MLQLISETPKQAKGAGIEMQSQRSETATFSLASVGARRTAPF
jgi:hypothetical protein